jgi:hypothetical protein
MSPPHHPANRHSYMGRPTRRTKQPILIAVAVNEPRPGRLHELNDRPVPNGYIDDCSARLRGQA